MKRCIFMAIGCSRRLLLALWALSLIPVVVYAQEKPTVSTSAADNLLQHFQDGNKAYMDEDYAKAVAEFNKVVDGGVVHPDLFFNLANAYVRIGKKGLAVLYYEKALDLDPSDESATANLAMVRKDLIDRVVMSGQEPVGEPLWQEFVRGLPVGGLTWSFLSLWLVFFVSLIGRRFIAMVPIRRLLFWINIPLVSLVLVLGLLLGSRVYVQERVHHGVVIGSVATLMEGPERTAKVLMEVHEGLKVRLLSDIGDYAHVRLSNGVEGFLHSAQIGRI